MTGHIDKLHDAVQAAQDAWNDRIDLVRKLEQERDEWQSKALRADREGGTYYKQWQEARADLERLRAAQPQLPDVGPVEDVPDSHTPAVRVDGQFWVKSSPDTLRRIAARALAVAAYLDTEADNTSSDDDEASALAKQYGDRPSMTHAMTSWRQVIDALDAHRARGVQEAGQKHNPWDAQRTRNVVGEPTREDARCGVCRG